jgi:hypothetical protein
MRIKSTPSSAQGQTLTEAQKEYNLAKSTLAKHGVLADPVPKPLPPAKAAKAAKAAKPNKSAKTKEVPETKKPVETSETPAVSKNPEVKAEVSDLTSAEKRKAIQAKVKTLRGKNKLTVPEKKYLSRHDKAKKVRRHLEGGILMAKDGRSF